MTAVSFSDHDAFQKSVLSGVLASAVLGLFVPPLTRLGLSPAALVLACMGAALACGTTVRSRAVFAALGAVIGQAGVLWPLHPLFGLAVTGAGMGLLFSLVRRRQPGSNDGRSQKGWGPLALAAGGGAMAVGAGDFVFRVAASHQLIEQVLPGGVGHAAQVALLGFFVSLGAAGAHVSVGADPVEKLYAQLAGELTGDLQALGSRAMTNYRRCIEVLTGSESGFARDQLSRTLSETTLKVLELARKWQAIDRELGAKAEREINLRREELRLLRDRTRDDSARRQLQLAEEAMSAELEQIERIHRGRERIVARLHGEMALLDRTRIALLGLKTSDTQLRAAELSAVSERLSSIAREMDSEAEAVDLEIGRFDGHGRGPLAPEAAAAGAAAHGGEPGSAETAGAGAGKLKA